MKFKIAGREIGNNKDPLIIAEIGINHNGNLDQAIAIADSAIKSGAEILKHQTHIPDEEMSLEAKRTIPGNSNKSIYSIIKQCALSETDEEKLMKYIKSKKKIFISTPFSKAAVDRLIRFGIPAFKIGSGEWNNLDLVKYVCKFKKPIIMSTGMSYLNELRKTVNYINNKKIPLALLHCTNVYPTPLQKSRLNSISLMKKTFKNNIIGYSDHTVGLHASYVALSLGAKIIEKHYVDTHDRKGPDVSCSMDKYQLQELLSASKFIPKSITGKKEPLKEEKVTMNFAFASVVSKIFINKGSSLNEKNICLKRPGNGDFLSKDFSKLIGKKAVVDIKKNIQIKKKYIK
ncbi:N-acetylneuraminate synthase family protein [Candidatus Pelagibacter sp. FZCC0015]|uniref:N-acetylneuraminate synthase family protein n=1 Tax=Candidatus Pelagibacter sp. FZCC0015 TaxID=2268451 RepID=UPI0011A67BD5|nr:N-acetylneuraminate synthase family protein [Candidatus Pelagibacter sp. FZCC0015]